jgi:hypothetical protein
MLPEAPSDEARRWPHVYEAKGEHLMSLLAHPLANHAEETFPAAQLSELAEQIWHDLSERVPRAEVHHLVVEAAAQFEGATVTTFIPLLIQRQVREKLHVTSLNTAHVLA